MTKCSKPPFDDDGVTGLKNKSSTEPVIFFTRSDYAAVVALKFFKATPMMRKTPKY